MQQPGIGSVLAACLVWVVLVAAGTAFGGVLGLLAAPKRLEYIDDALVLAAVGSLVGLAGGVALAAWSVRRLRGNDADASPE